MVDEKLSKKQLLILQMHSTYAMMEYLFVLANLDKLILPKIDTNIPLKRIIEIHEWITNLHEGEFQEPHRLRQIHEPHVWKLLEVSDNSDMREIKLFKETFRVFKQAVKSRKIAINETEITNEHRKQAKTKRNMAKRDESNSEQSRAKSKQSRRKIHKN